jgi:hypothetical protein
MIAPYLRNIANSGIARSSQFLKQPSEAKVIRQKSIEKKPRGPGRPQGRLYISTAVSLPAHLLDAVEEFAVQYDLSRAEAGRALIELGLEKAKATPNKTTTEELLRLRVQREAQVRRALREGSSAPASSGPPA